MKTNSFIAASACIASLAMASSLTSCSNDEMIVDEPQLRNEIRFNVTSDRATRATQYGQASQILQFNVCAWVRNSSDTDPFGSTGSGHSYFKVNGDQVSRLSSSAAWTYSDGVRYWPNNGEVLDFYAWVDDSNSASITFGSSRPSLHYSTGTDVANMADLLTADDFSKKSTSESNGKSTAELNFNHALAKVNVSLKVVNPKIQMEVSEVALVNIATEGDYLFETPKGEKAGWDNTTTTSIENLIITPSTPSTITNNGTMNVTGTTPFMVIPATYTHGNNPADNTDKGAFFRIKCKIWNVAEANGAKTDNDLLIFGTNVEDGYAYLYVPADFTWEIGKNYTYTISFGTGNAGLDAQGKKTLVMIDWSVDSTAWSDGTINGSTDPKEITE